MVELITVASWMTGAACAGWIATCALATFRVLRLPEFEPERVAPLPNYPRLSVVIPACNEEATLEAAMCSLLAEDYPDLEIVIVDDRSTDRTPQIVDQLAARDARVVPLHITELPEDWLGKLHALHRGTEAATGDWLLFADADVHYVPGALRAAVAFLDRDGLDHLGLIPDIERRGVLHTILTETFGIALVLAVPLHRVNQPDSKHFMGVGAFNLVRRAAFERTEGFEWLRMEIADDMGLGLLLHRHGARSWVGVAPKALELAWYDGAAEMMRGLSKNLFAATAHLSFVRAGLLTAVIFGALLAPIVGALLPAPLGWPLSVAVVAALVVLSVVTAVKWDANPLAVACLPVGVAMLGFALATSTLEYWRNGGAVWRGTRYPLARLRALQRVKV